MLLMRNLLPQEVQLKEVLNRIKKNQFSERKQNFILTRSYYVHTCFSFLSDAYLQRIVSEKRLTLINAWEESEKARAENR
jgi:hypothetical protein